MIHLKSLPALLAAGVLCAAGFIVWPGCATPPLPYSRTPVSALKKADFSFRGDAHPNQAEIFAKLGGPDEYFYDVRVACYKLNAMKRRRLWLFLGVLPIAAPKDADALEVAFIQFDRQDVAQRVGIKVLPYASTNIGHEPLRLYVRDWLSGTNHISPGL